MNRGFLKTTLAILFAILLFFFFSIMRSVIDTVNTGEEMKSLRTTDPNKDTL